MKKLSILFALLGVVALVGAAGAVENQGSVGIGVGITLPSGDDACPGTLCLNYDGSAENGYCWQYGGIAPPYYGAFAECCEGGPSLCGVQLHLTGVGYPCEPSDVYVWDDAGGMPGNVLCISAGFNPCPVATWPAISVHDACFDCATGNGIIWGGYWLGGAVDNPCGYFIAADLDGFGGCPMTNIAPGIGYPTGWNNVSTIWGPTQAIGIGLYCGDCDGGNPTEETTWGAIKALYN
jgi:hypothetical protein